MTAALINWYKTDVAPKTESELDDVLMPFLSKIIGVVVFAVATLMVLSILQIEITPLIATMGVGGSFSASSRRLPSSGANAERGIGRDRRRRRSFCQRCTRIE